MLRGSRPIELAALTRSIVNTPPASAGTRQWPGWRGIVLAAALAGCAAHPHGPEEPSTNGENSPALGAEEGRALVGRLLPSKLGDRAGWARDVFAAFGALELAPTTQNICATLAVVEQESGFQVDPPVPGLSRIAWTEIERERERAGIPKLVLQAALALPSSDGRSFSARLDTVKTEQQLSAIFDDFIGMVPLGKTFLSDRNPVRTGGPMQVSRAFAEMYAHTKPYPYPVSGTLAQEVFTRRGGLYFGIAHLLDYAAPYERFIYRFADFNAGRYASRNAAFQSALTQASGIPLALDGDLLRYEHGRAAQTPSETELGARVLARRLRMSDADIRRDLELAKTPRFEQSNLYRRGFTLAEQLTAKPLPRAVLPTIALKSPKITRNLTTDWFARQVDERYRRCLERRATPDPR